MSKVANVLRCLTAALLVSALLTPVSTLEAQEKPPERVVVEVGARALAGDHASSKFNEYRDLHPGFFVQALQANLDHLFGSKYFFTVQSRNSIDDDRAFRATFGKTGRFHVDFNWQDTPHDFTNTARTLYTTAAPGVVTIPAVARTTLMNDPSAALSLMTGIAPADVAMRRRLGSGVFEYTPTAGWAFRLKYSHENDNGARPFGAMLNGFANMLEVPQPIDYRVHEVAAELEYGNRRGGFQAGYTASIFNNEIPALVFDNPFRNTDALGGSSRGRMALYPDNNAQTLSFAGALNLSESTRLMGAISPQWMRQNAPFLPYTINSLAGVPDLPAPGLNGRRKRLAMNYTLASHPTKTLSVTAHFRDYDYDNDTPGLLFPSYVQADLSIENLRRQNLPYSFNRQNVGLDVTWMPHKGDALTLGYQFENLDRAYREVLRSREHIGSATVDLNPRKWMIFRANFTHAQRNPQEYTTYTDPNAAPDNSSAVGLPLGWRMFDQAARTRNKAEALLELDPSDRLSITASFDTLQDRFGDSIYGVLGNRGAEAVVEASYLVGSKISVTGNYTYERYNSDQRSREYAGPAGSAPANNSRNNDWESYIRDGIHTIGGGVSASRLLRKTTFDAFYSLSIAKGRIDNRILGNPSLPGFLVTEIQDYPETGNRFHTFAGAARYQINRAVSARAEYRYERYNRSDFQIAGISPYVAPLDPRANTSLLLGADVPGYHVHILSISLEYRF